MSTLKAIGIKISFFIPLAIVVRKLSTKNSRGAFNYLEDFKYILYLFRFQEQHVKVSSRDPSFEANYYSNSKKLVMEINVSMS